MLFHLKAFITSVCICIPAAAFISSRRTWQHAKYQRHVKQHTYNNMLNAYNTELRENASAPQIVPARSVVGTDSYDEHDFIAYHQTIEDILSKKNVLREFKRNEADLKIVKALMLNNKRTLPRWDICQFIMQTTNDATENKASIDREKSVSYAKQRLQERRQMYLDQTGITAHQHKLAVTLLSQLGDHCAKTRNPKPLYIAWEKIIEAGMTPMSRVLSTYLYVLSLDEEGDGSDRDLSAEVATFHDAIYEPNEKTITLLVKSLVRRGDATGAEALLDNIAVRFLICL